MDHIFHVPITILLLFCLFGLCWNIHLVYLTLRFLNIWFFLGVGSLASCPTHNLENLDILYSWGHHPWHVQVARPCQWPCYHWQSSQHLLTTQAPPLHHSNDNFGGAVSHHCLVISFLTIVGDLYRSLSSLLRIWQRMNWKMIRNGWQFGFGRK